MTLRVSVRMLAKTSHRAFVSHLFKKLDLSHQVSAALKGRTNSIRCKFRVLKDRKTISSCT